MLNLWEYINNIVYIHDICRFVNPFISKNGRIEILSTLSF